MIMIMSMQLVYYYNNLNTLQMNQLNKINNYPKVKQEVKDLVTKDVFDSYFKFTLMRDPKDWFINWAHFRANETAKDISQLYVNHKIDNGQPIVAVGVTAMVQAAYDEKIVITAKESNETGFGKTM